MHAAYPLKYIREVLQLSNNMVCLSEELKEL